MADLNARNTSFIELLLDLSGRVRPSDFTAMSPDAASALLQSYAASHPGLTFDGDSLAPAKAEPVQPPAPVQPQAPVQPLAPVQTPAAEPVQPLAPIPIEPLNEESVRPPSPSPVEPLDAGRAHSPAAPAPVPPAPWESVAEPFSPDTFATPDHQAPFQPSYPAPASVEAPQEYPPPQPFSVEPVPSRQSSETLPEIVAPYGSSAGIYPPPVVPEPFGSGEEPPPPAAPETYPSVEEPPPPVPPVPLQAFEPSPPMAPVPLPEPESPGVGVSDEPTSAPPAIGPTDEPWDYTSRQQSASDYFTLPMSDYGSAEEPVPWYWWFAVVVFSFIGAFVAWFVNRGRPGSRAFLYVGIALLALTVVVGIALAILVMMSR